MMRKSSAVAVVIIAAAVISMTIWLVFAGVETKGRAQESGRSHKMIN